MVDMIIAVVRVEPNGKCTIGTWTPLGMNGVNGFLCGMAWCGVVCVPRRSTGAEFALVSILDPQNMVQMSIRIRIWIRSCVI